MDRLLESVDQQASWAAMNTVVEEQFDEGLFQQFMSKNSAWDFHSMTKEQYLAKSKDQKSELIKNYYCTMKNDEPFFYFCLFCLKNVSRLA